MRVILSRKGFDDENGGCPSPILPDGTMVSMPIPEESCDCRYDDLLFPGGRSYADVWHDLNPSRANTEHCHLDPDIRPGVRKSIPQNWVPAFGQIGAAETHLENNGVSVGDLFLFFGYFQKGKLCNDSIRYDENAQKIHAIYGYLQIGKIIKGLDVKNYPWHPHSDDRHIYNQKGCQTNNTMYIASSELVFPGEKTGLPGSGVFNYSEKRVLTLPGTSKRTNWKVNEVFGTVPLTYHSVGSLRDGYFKSASRGQEFIFDEDDRVVKWARSLFD